MSSVAWRPVSASGGGAGIAHAIAAHLGRKGGARRLRAFLRGGTFPGYDIARGQEVVGPPLEEKSGAGVCGGLRIGEVVSGDRRGKQRHVQEGPEGARRTDEPL